MFCIRAIAAGSLLFDSVPSRSSTSIHELALRRPLSNGDGCDSPRVAKAMTRVRPVLHDWSLKSQIKDRSLESCTGIFSMQGI